MTCHLGTPPMAASLNQVDAMPQPTDDPTTEPSHDPIGEARARISEMTRLFEEIRLWLDRCIALEGPVTKMSAQKMLTKLGELQTAHLMVMRAEEVFHDKFKQDTAGPGIDYDAVRRDLGRALDRIRAANDADGLSE